MLADPRVQQRKDELLAEAKVTLDRIRAVGSAAARDPLLDPGALALAVTRGILDAPHLRNNRYALGRIATAIDERGACVAVDPKTRQHLSETQRLARLGQ